MRLLLIQFCTVLSLGAFSQKISPNNKVLIENFPQASTYSIELQYSTGVTTSLGSSKVYIAAMFPQLDKLKMVKENGDVVVKVIVTNGIELPVIRHREEFKSMLANYDRIKPLPANSSAEPIRYFQPLNIVFQSKGSTFFTMVSIGTLHTGGAQKHLGVKGDTSKEKTDALSSLYFLRSHVFDLQGKPQ